MGGFFRTNLTVPERILFALGGVLMIDPGLVTDLVGLILLAGGIGLQLWRVRQQPHRPVWRVGLRGPRGLKGSMGDQARGEAPAGLVAPGRPTVGAAQGGNKGRKHKAGRPSWPSRWYAREDSNL